jgi:hypothetical protein
MINAILQRVSTAFVVFPVVILMLSIASCDSTPTTGQARAELEQYLQTRWPMLRIKSFERVNGAGDSHNYTISYRAEIEVGSDGSAWDTPYHNFHLISLNGFRWLRPAPGQETEHAPPPTSIRFTPIPFETVTKGGIFEIKGDYDFYKTEKGWIHQR